jgi:hypothetical protein
MLDRSHVGRTFAPFTVSIDPFQLRLFAKAIREERPEYLSEAAALALGMRGLPAPPTFLFSVWMQDPVPLRLTAELKLDIGRVLHGEQSFSYGTPLYSGDTITVQERISDIYEKRGGALEFIVSELDATNQLGERVGTATCTTVYRN